MAKKTVAPLDAPGVLAPTPAMPVERATMWERHPAHTADEIAHDYPLQLPRWLHKDGATALVSTPEACETALDDGWVVHPGDAPRKARAAARV